MDAHVFPKASGKAAKLLALADFIEQGSVAFGMHDWETCIAGQCARMNKIPTHHSSTFAGHWLNLTCSETGDLLSPESDVLGDRPVSLIDITRQWAVATLRHFAVTGQIDWVKTRPAERFHDRWVQMIDGVYESPRQSLLDHDAPTIHCTVTMPELVRLA